MDVTKQFCGLFLVHVFNVMAASQLSTMTTSADECSWYFITYLTDILFTTFFCFLIMKMLDSYFKSRGLDHLVTGNYFKNTKISCLYWVQQILIWLVTLLLVALLYQIKVTLYLIQLPVLDILGAFSNWALKM